MGLGDIFGRREEPEEGEEEYYMEVDMAAPGPASRTLEQRSAGTGRFGLRIESLEDFSDTERILRQIRDGHIIFLRIKGLKEKDMGELKRAVEKLKKSVAANSGSIIGAEENWLVLAPENIVLQR